MNKDFHPRRVSGNEHMCEKIKGTRREGKVAFRGNKLKKGKKDKRKENNTILQ